MVPGTNFQKWCLAPIFKSLELLRRGRGVAVNGAWHQFRKMVPGTNFEKWCLAPIFKSLAGTNF
jgi:hypothetical protein